MNRFTVTMADDANPSGLDGQWAPILQTGTYDGETYTPADLDAMVSEYENRDDAGKAPVALGVPTQIARSNEAPIGKIDALRRNGKSLQAKFVGIDPRVEQLHAKGVFPKKSIQLKRSPDGASLQRVGLIHPVWDQNRWNDEITPSLDELMKENFGNKDHIFSETPLAGQWLELFRSGDYGEKGSFSNSDLDQIVKNFDPSFHEPPAVIGHPEHDAPAYAWVEGLKRNGDKLLGKLRQVDPTFEDMVKAGRFKKRSIALYQTAKGWMLRHVGFLGAQPPEVKGLVNAAFKEDRIRFVTVTFGEAESSAKSAIARLKATGYWLPLMDQIGFSEMLATLDGQPLLDRVVAFTETALDALNIDPGGVRLCYRAKQFASFHGVSFGEALDQVREREEMSATLSSAADSGLSGVALSERAYEIMWRRGVSFGEALTEAAQDNPELTR